MSFAEKSFDEEVTKVTNEVVSDLLVKSESLVNVQSDSVPETKEENKNSNEKIEEFSNENLSNPLSLSATNTSLSSFSRNSTLTRSQRKKVLPQGTIKKFMTGEEEFSPPVINGESSSSSSSQPLQTNGDNLTEEREENFIVSSPLNESTLPADRNVSNDHLGSSNHSSLNDNTLNTTSIGIDFHCSVSFHFSANTCTITLFSILCSILFYYLVYE